jgi:hypothetical protein
LLIVALPVVLRPPVFHAFARDAFLRRQEKRTLLANTAPGARIGVGLRALLKEKSAMTQPPANPLLDRLLDPVTRCLTPEVARELVALRADPQFQERLDTLADKCTEGELSPDEREEYETYVRAIHIIAILQAKALKLLANPPPS